MKYFIIFIITFATTLYTLKWYRKYQKRPSISNIIKAIKEVNINKDFFFLMKEKEIEEMIAEKLRMKFAKTNVNTQYPLSEERQIGARERIDIDINEGKLGIEIKLARSLQRSNERNRLIGQLAFYQNRKYNQNNLLVVIIGRKNKLDNKITQELKNIIEQNNIKFLTLKVD